MAPRRCNGFVSSRNKPLHCYHGGYTYRLISSLLCSLPQGQPATDVDEMPGRCAVPLCNSQIGGFRFPCKEGQRNKWIQAVKRLTLDKKTWYPSPNDVVCPKHFTEEDYKEQKPFAKGRRRLNSEAVPSIFPFKKPLSTSENGRKARAACRQRSQEENARQKKEKVVKNEEAASSEFFHEKEHFLGSLEDCIFVGANAEVASDITHELGETTPLAGENEEVGSEVTPELKEEAVVEELKPKVGPKKRNVNSDAPYRIEKYIGNDEAMKYLTGFDSYEHFLLLFNILGPACFELKYKSELNAQNELFLTLIKIRHAKDDFALSLDFGIGRNIVSRIVRTWINFLYFELSDLDFWCEREVIDQHFPSKFQKMFPKTRVILDATEIPIQKPSNCNSQRITFSTYKNGNTLKTMVGISPRGVVTYISDSYGGSVSDRQIIEKSPLVKPGMLGSGDSIMADRGIMVQDLFANRNIQVNTPTTMKGRNQHEPETVIKDRRIASKRIHVERVIGYAKTFKILCRKLKKEQITMGSRLVKVCFLLTNFRNNIVGKRA